MLNLQQKTKEEEFNQLNKDVLELQTKKENLEKYFSVKINNGSDNGSKKEKNESRTNGHKLKRNEKELAIKALLESGKTYRQISQELQVSQRDIAKVKNSLK